MLPDINELIVIKPVDEAQLLGLAAVAVIFGVIFIVTGVDPVDGQFKVGEVYEAVAVAL